ncbi:putative mitochondrial protein [Tanacetum coccineum]
MSTYEKEYLAIIYALEKWRGYLLDRHFKIKTDHFSLKYLLDKRMSTPTQLKWLLELMGFDYEIHYKKWVENVIVDAFSRLHSSSELFSIISSSLTPGIYQRIMDSWKKHLKLKEITEKLKQSCIPIIKVRRNSRRGSEFTWECEEQFKKKYLHLFTNHASSSNTTS